MTINPSEQRELADYIAHKLVSLLVAPRLQEKETAEIVWNAIEDYTYEPSGPDMLELAKARMEDEA